MATKLQPSNSNNQQPPLPVSTHRCPQQLEIRLDRIDAALPQVEAREVG